MLRLCLIVFCFVQFQGAFSSYICDRSKPRNFPDFNPEFSRGCSCCTKQPKQTSTIYHDKPLHRFQPIECEQCNFSHSDIRQISPSLSKTLSSCSSDILIRSKKKPILTESRRIVHPISSSEFHAGLGCAYIPSPSSLIEGCPSLPDSISQGIRVVRESPSPTEMPEVVERGETQMETGPQSQEQAPMEPPCVESETVTSRPPPMESMDEGVKTLSNFPICNEEGSCQSSSSLAQSQIPFPVPCPGETQCNEVTSSSKNIPIETMSMESETSEQKVEDESTQTMQESQPPSPPCVEEGTCSSASPIYPADIEEEISMPVALASPMSTEETLPPPASDHIENEIESHSSSLVVVPRSTRGATPSVVSSCSTTCEVCPRPTTPPITTTTLCNKPCRLSLTDLVRNFNPLSTTLKPILPSCTTISSPCFSCINKPTYSILQELSSCTGRSVAHYKPVYEEVIRHVPVVKNVIRNRVVETTRHVPVVEKTVLHEQNKVIRHIPIVQTIRRNVVECRTNHIPIVQHCARTIEEPYTVHVAHTEKITRPVIDSYVKHVPVVYTQTKPVVRERIRHVPVVETRCRPVVEDTVTTVPVKRRIVKNIVELKLRPVITPCETPALPEPVILEPEACDPYCENVCPY